MTLSILTPLLGGLLSAVAASGPVSDGLILHLDAATQVRSGGKGSGNNVWRNLADRPERVAGSAALKNFPFDDSAGWVGTGQPGDPFALRFDGKRAYAEGPGNLEIGEMTIEVWARVRGVRGPHGMRGATLLGTDYGKGGVGLLIGGSGSPLLLHGAAHSPLPADTPLDRWAQVVAAMKDGVTRMYVNGQLACAAPTPRALQADHPPLYQLGTARFTTMDYVACDGLVGEITVVRVYRRCLSVAEVRANFEADRERIGVAVPEISTEPVRSTPVPQIAGLGPAPAARCVKWDYYHNPVGVTATELSASPARCAFDGYPTGMTQPYAGTLWRSAAPTPNSPAYAVIDYKRPVAVTRLVHYFERGRTPAPWKDVEVFTSDDLDLWHPLASFTSLPPDCPQVIPIDRPRTARFYKLVVRAMGSGAGGVAAHEIETYYGATIGSVDVATKPVLQSEPCRLSVRVVSPDSTIQGASLRLVLPEKSVRGVPIASLPLVPQSGQAVGSFEITPLYAGAVPAVIELHAGGHLIDRRPFTLRVQPKLVFADLSPAGAVIAEPGQSLTIKGTVANAGRQPAAGVYVGWLGQTTALGDMAPGAARAFEITVPARPGYAEGELTARAESSVQTAIRRGVICSTARDRAARVKSGRSEWSVQGHNLRVAFQAIGLPSPVMGTLQLMAGGKPVPLVPASIEGNAPSFSAAVPGGVFVMEPAAGGSIGVDEELNCRVVPDDPNATDPLWLDLEIRLGVDDPRVMFRPHIDWYTVDHGPNWRPLQNAHNSATRMLCVQTPTATVSMVPDTDNLTWGFTSDHQMTAKFQIRLANHDPVGRTIWHPIDEAPRDFRIRIPVRKGDWWEAFRHVAVDVFRFEEPRQWPMPLTQMQSLTTRAIMSYGAWSERWQMVRAYSNDSVLWTFYGAVYSLPALYNWHLATDDPIAKAKAEKIVQWLLRVQHKDGPMAGAWFTAYSDKGESELVGGDFINNRWLIPQSTGATVKTLLWYWNASGRKDSRALSAARRGCDWLLKTLRSDGGWPYAFDLNGKPITDQCGAGQIWCTWALWRMYALTGDAACKEAAQRSAAFFERNYMKVHRYVGYWEDTVGITRENNKAIQSWEAYEAAIAVQVFAEMGDRKRAIDAAQDLATHTWTRVTSTRRYETSYGQTTEQALCGPSQAQSPMVGIAFKRVYELTNDRFWNDLSGAAKTAGFCADPDSGYAMVATSGWADPLNAVASPPYENVRPFVTPDMRRGDYGRQIWYQWCTDQFAWLTLEWLVREGNLRAAPYLRIDPETLRGTLLGAPGRVKMPEEKCDVNGFEHYDINWVGYQNQDQYCLLLMNHKEQVTVAVRPREAHLDVYSRPPRLLVGGDGKFRELSATKKGIQYLIDLPPCGTALLIWQRIK
jgi:hypothetical protein